jgi:hypothetical protein
MRLLVRCAVSAFLSWIAVCLGALLAGQVAQPGGTDLRALAVENFMAARTLRDNVEARKLMTAALEQDYQRGKRLSIRVRSGRIVAFNYDPASIKSSGDKAFEGQVESLWADLNEQVFATQYERIKFIKFKDDWLADEIEFLKSVPGRRVLPFNVVSEKRGKLAVETVKKFMKDFINRNPTLAIESLTQEFQNRFRSQQELEAFLVGPTDPYYAAYELHTLTQTDPREMEVKLKIYLVSKGKKGAESQEARLVVKEGKTDWNIDQFEFIKS